MINTFTDYSTKSNLEYDHNHASRVKFREDISKLRDIAKDMDTFGGRRFLGLNKNGNEVWISYTIDKDTLDLQIKSTHDLNSIVELAPKRVTVGMNENTPLDIMEARHSDTGAVTHNTLRYLQRLMDLPKGVGYVEGKCSSQLFMHVSNAIYEGEWDLYTNKVRWIDILQAWSFPTGRYFTVYG